MIRAFVQRMGLVALPVIACLALMPAAHAFSLSDLFGGGDDKMEALADNPLASMLTDQLGVSTEQAAGGAGALLSMAASQLSGDQASELTKLIPGSENLIDAIPAGLGGMLNNMDALGPVFTALGLDAGMISQFVPIITQFLGTQGASAGLIDTLTKIWTPAS
ncbi:DUF2780 domain-containing protein [Photobacterium galatheae]|uniref:DUF2780 domain-containing protein n=1 Tax=Photobacterium galatheae TaxID=1654360 RepID=A0A066RIU0_9GAMM|nr:hypothetical protein EA58_17895 [Photobacterium galatheae]